MVKETYLKKLESSYQYNQRGRPKKRQTNPLPNKTRLLKMFEVLFQRNKLTFEEKNLLEDYQQIKQLAHASMGIQCRFPTLCSKWDHILSPFVENAYENPQIEELFKKITWDLKTIFLKERISYLNCYQIIETLMDDFQEKIYLDSDILQQALEHLKNVLYKHTN